MQRVVSWGGALVLGLSLSLSVAAPARAVSSTNEATAARILWQDRDDLAPSPDTATAVPAPPRAKRGVAVRYDRAWVDSRPEPRGDKEWQCLATALYFEARGESVRGQFAVAEVILNRTGDSAYPDTVCGVVYQDCQFSFTCDNISERIREPAAFARAGKIADMMLQGAPRTLTRGATHFHTRAVSPGWARRLPRTTQIGAHLFYRNASN